MKLSKKDYLTILKFYNVNLSENMKYKTLKDQAENILNNKLCKCIKKVNTGQDDDESRAIAICKKSVLNKKGIKSGKFSCKKPKHIILKIGRAHV